MKEPAYELVRFLTHLRYEKIPPQAVEAVSLDVLDFFGNALGGSADPAVLRVLEVMTAMGGAPQCGVLGDSHKLPAANAALVNGVMGFALDYDDTHERANTHLGVACIPAALAAAQLAGGVDGKRFLTAVAGGMELAARLGIGCRRKIEHHIMGGWDYAALHGCFSAAAAAGLLLGLDENGMLNALGIAYQQAAGNTLSAMEEADTKKLGPGFAARNGVTAALMAGAGLTGCRSVFSGSPYSLFPMYHDGGDGEKVIQDLGRRFVIEEIGFKPYPCCRLGHRYVDAVLRLMKAHALTSGQVERVVLSVCPQVDVQLCRPRENKTAPRSRSAAQFSLPWMVSCALARGKVGIGDFLPESLSDPKLLDLAGKVITVRDDALADEKTPARVVLDTSRGRYACMTEDPYGSRENPMSRADLEKKFRDSVLFAGHAQAKEGVERMLENLRKLTELDDICVLMERT